MVENLADALRLLLVTDEALLAERDPVAVCVEVVGGGVTMVQLRCKEASSREILTVARHLVPAIGVPLIINDRLDVALAANAAGVHLGVDDIPPTMARRVAPPGFVIGGSVGAEEEVGRNMAADYWGIGPFRPTATKPDAGAGLGLTRSSELLALAKSRPCVAIGGVRAEDVGPLLGEGFLGVAVVSGILASAEPGTAASRYRAAVDAVRSNSHG